MANSKKGAGKVRALRQAAKRKMKDIGKQSKMISKERATGSTPFARQTRAMAKQSAGIDGGSRRAAGVKQSKDDDAKPGKVGSEGAKSDGNFGKVRRSEVRFRPPKEDWEMPLDWTEQQERALQEARSTIGPVDGDWHLIAERVSGRSPRECFRKFYGERMITRSARRSCPPEEPSLLRINNGPNDGALTRQTRASSQGTNNCRIEGASISPSVSQTEDAKPEIDQGEHRVMLGRKARINNGPNDGAFTRQTRARSQATNNCRIQGTNISPPSVSQTEEAKREIDQGEHRRTSGRNARNGTKEIVGECLEKRSEALVLGPDRLSGVVGDREVDSDSASTGATGDELWTQAQEAALHDAYSTIRPSADFWHHISKRVPGRNAEECFNRFYSDHPTPPRAAQRSCLREIESSVPPLKPPKAKAARAKQRLLEAHRTVRKILRKQQVDDEDYETDAFRALEHPDVVLSVTARAKNDEAALNEAEIKRYVAVRGLGSSREYPGVADKENRKPKTAGNFGGALSQVDSPEVLKKVKDLVMLDKYIDHLHQRDTRRAKKTNHRSKNYLDVGDAIQHAKQELKNVFSSSGTALGDFIESVGSPSDEEDEEF